MDRSNRGHAGRKKEADEKEIEDEEIIKEEAENPNLSRELDEPERKSVALMKGGKLTNAARQKDFFSMIGRVGQDPSSIASDIVANVAEYGSNKGEQMLLHKVMLEASILLGKAMFTDEPSSDMSLIWDGRRTGDDGLSGGSLVGAIRTTASMNGLFTLVNVGTSLIASADDPTGGPVADPSRRTYYDNTAEFLTQNLLDDGFDPEDRPEEVASRFFDGTTFNTVGGYPDLMGRRFEWDGTKIRGQGLLEGMMSRVGFYTRKINQLQQIYTTGSGPVSMLLDFRHADWLAAPRSYAAQMLPSFMPQIPLNSKFWAGGHVKAEAEAQFGTQPGRIEVILPLRQFTTRFQIGSMSMLQRIQHSIDPLSTRLNLRYHFEMERAAVTDIDYQQMMLILAGPEEDFIPDRTILNWIVGVSEPGKKMLDLMSILSVDHLAMRIEQAKNDLMDVEIMAPRSEKEMQPLRRGITLIGMDGKSTLIKDDVSRPAQGKLAQPVNGNDLIELLLSEQFGIFRPAYLKPYRNTEILSGEGFIEWLNGMLIYLVFDGLSPQSVADLYLQGMWMFGLTGLQGAVPFSAAYPGVVPQPQSLMRTPSEFPRALQGQLNLNTDQMLRSYINLFIRNPNADKNGYNYNLNKRILKATISPFSTNPRTMRSKYFDRDPGSRNTVWLEVLRDFLNAVSSFLNNLKTPQIQVKGKDVNSMTKLLLLLISKVEDTADPVSVIIGNMRLVQAVSITQFRTQYYIDNEPKKWLAEHEPGHYKMKASNMTMNLLGVGYVTPYGKEFKKRTVAKSSHIENIVSRDTNPIDFNMIGFLFGTKAIQYYSLSKSPEATLLNQVNESWEASKLIRVNEITSRLLSGDLGRHAKFIMWNIRNAMSKGNTIALWKNICDQLGVSVPSAFKATNYESMGLAPKLAIDQKTLQYGVDNGGNVVWTPAHIRSMYEEDLAAVMGPILDGFEPLEHWTRFIVFKRSVELTMEFATIATAKKRRVIRGIGIGALARAQQQTIDAVTFLSVTKLAFAFGDNGLLEEQGVEYPDNDDEAISLKAIVEDKTHGYYMEYEVFESLQPWIRRIMFANISAGFDLVVGGMFKYRYAVVKDNIETPMTNLEEWFKNPSPTTTWVQPIYSPSPMPRYLSVERMYAVQVKPGDGFVYQMPAQELPLDGLTPTDFECQKYDATDYATWSNYCARGEFAAKILGMFGADNEYRHMYSDFYYVISSTSPGPGEMSGINFNRIAYRREVNPYKDNN